MTIFVCIVIHIVRYLSASTSYATKTSHSHQNHLYSVAHYCTQVYTSHHLWTRKGLLSWDYTGHFAYL